MLRLMDCSLLHTLQNAKPDFQQPTIPILSYFCYLIQEGVDHNDERSIGREGTRTGTGVTSTLV